MRRLCFFFFGSVPFIGDLWAALSLTVEHLPRRSNILLPPKLHFNLRWANGRFVSKHSSDKAERVRRQMETFETIKRRVFAIDFRRRANESFPNSNSNSVVNKFRKWSGKRNGWEETRENFTVRFAISWNIHRHLMPFRSRCCLFMVHNGIKKCV